MDDVPEIRDLVATILSVRGYEVEVASDGLEALRSLDARSYDVIVSDMRMPGLDGPGLYNELQRRDPANRPRLLFISGSSSVHAYADFLATINVPVLEKPFNLDDLCRIVERILAAP